MRAPALSPRDRRAVRAGLAVLAPLLLWTFAAAPYLRALEDAHTRLSGSRELLRRELELVAAAPRMAAELERAVSELALLAPRLFDQPPGGLLEAALTDYARERADGERVRLTVLAPAPAPQPESRLAAAALAVAGETDLEGLLTFLAALEDGPKLVQVRGVRVEAAGSPGQAAAGAEVLSFNLVLTGFALGGDGDGAGRGARAAPPAAGGR